MPTIQDNINAVIKTISDQRDADPNGHSAKADEVQDKAIEAIHQGDGSEAWRIYMSLFAGNPPDPLLMARLVPDDGTGGGTDPHHPKRRARAYLVSNGVCGATTTDHLDREVTGILDS